MLILLSCIYGVGSGGGRGRDCWKAERLTLGAVTPLFPLRSVVVIVIGFLSLPLLASSSSSPCWHGNVVVVVWPSCPIVRVSSDSWSLSLSFCRGCRHPWLWLSSSPCRHEIVVIVTSGCRGIGHVLCRRLGLVMRVPPCIGCLSVLSSLSSLYWRGWWVVQVIMVVAAPSAVLLGHCKQNERK